MQGSPANYVRTKEHSLAQSAWQSGKKRGPYRKKVIL